MSDPQAIVGFALPQDTPALGAYLARQRWFASKDRRIRRVGTGLEASLDAGRWLLAIVEVDFDDGEPQQYFLPLCAGPGSDADAAATVARLPSGDALRDASVEPAFVHALLRAMASGAVLATNGGARIAFVRTTAWPDPAPPAPAIAPAGVEQSNTSIRVDGYGALKLYRRVQRGATSPEIEVARFLTEQGFAHTAPLLASIELQPADGAGDAAGLGVLFGWIDNRGDAWKWALDDLRGRLQRGGDDAFFEQAALLGRRTAEMHRTLCPGAAVDAAFAPEPITADDLQTWRDRVAADAQALLDRAAADSDGPLAPLLASREALTGRLRQLFDGAPLRAVKTRFHGDYHLGQVLYTGSDFVIIDFEGEPRRSVAERRAKQSPLKDVAGMLRSFDYAAAAVLRDGAPGGDAGAARAWAARAQRSFLDGYRRAIDGCPTYPDDERQAAALLQLLTLDKALYEIGYELANRPDWVSIPVQGVLALLADDPADPIPHTPPKRQP